MKIKTIPEDFLVEEIAQLPLTQQGEYSVYLLEKRGWNTIDLLHRLAKMMHVTASVFSYGGKKDRHGITRQFVTVKNGGKTKVQEKNFSLEWLGVMKRPMGPDLIEGNRFAILLRDCDAEEEAQMRGQLPRVKESGFVNYFDDQRFGSYDEARGFFGEKVLKKHFAGAAAIYCHDAQVDVPAAKDSLAFLDGLPRETLSTYFSAYQSFLWNAMARSLVVEHADAALLRHAGRVGEYVFYAALTPEQRQFFSAVALAMPGMKPQHYNDVTLQLYSRVLEENGIRQGMFNNCKLRRAYFRSFSRRLVVIPAEVSAETAQDERYVGKQKLLLKFFLPRGSFATMFIKRLCASPD